MLLLVIAFTMIASITFAQMKRTENKQVDVFGVKVNYVLYQPKIQSDSWFVFFHGAGEVGPSDGSQLYKVDAHGYTKHAKAGHEFPFNIIAIQAQSYFTSLDKYLLEWLRVRYGAKKILISGLSRGGQETHNLTMADLSYRDTLIVAAVPIAGRPDAYSTADPKTVKDVPMIVVHGEKDNVVPYSQDKTWCERVNAVPGRKNPIRFISLPNVAHEGWTWAYSLDPNNEVYQFIHRMLEPDVVLDRYQQGYDYALNKIQTYLDSIK